MCGILGDNKGQEDKVSKWGWGEGHRDAGGGFYFKIRWPGTASLRR